MIGLRHAAVVRINHISHTSRCFYKKLFSMFFSKLEHKNSRSLYFLKFVLYN